MTNQPLPSDFSGNLNSDLPRHRAFVKAALTRLVELQPDALNRDGKLYEVWSGANEPRPEPTKPPAQGGGLSAGQLVTMAQAAAIFGRSPTQAQLDDLNACLKRFSINTPARIRHFFAQVAHESGGLRWMKELASGDDYEGRKDLGNTIPGDGPKFKGAGALQLTGRCNYQRLSDFLGDGDVMLGCEYVANRYPFTSAGFWWNLNAMNSFIDNGASCRQVSAKINGRDPANGLAEREAYHRKAVEVIGAGTNSEQKKPTGLDPRGKEEEGLIGPKIAAPVKPGDSYLLVNDRDRDMEAYDHTGKLLWKIPCLASGQHPNWKKTGGDTPPGLYKIGQIYRDYEANSKPPQSDTAESYGWYSFDLVELENQEAANGRAGIMIHGGGTACGWPGAWAERQTLHPTLGCIRVHNIDCRDRILPLCSKGTVYIGVFQQ
jgi:predicted chitinase